MTNELKQVFFVVCLGFYVLTAIVVKTSPATLVDGLITAAVFTAIAVAAYFASEP